MVKIDTQQQHTPEAVIGGDVRQFVKNNESNTFTKVNDSEDDDDMVEAHSPFAVDVIATRKKKKSKKSKSKKAKQNQSVGFLASSPLASAPGLRSSGTNRLSALESPAFGAGSKAPAFRGVSGYTDSFTEIGQTEPATVPIAKLYPDGKYPVGEIHAHPGDFNTYRVTSEEKRTLDRAGEELYEKLRQASEVHRHVRKFAQGLIKPGIKLTDLCTQLENKNRELVVEAGLAVRVFAVLCVCM